jgi:hypothetical protein
VLGGINIWCALLSRCRAGPVEESARAWAWGTGAPFSKLFTRMSSTGGFRVVQVVASADRVAC